MKKKGRILLIILGVLLLLAAGLLLLPAKNIEFHGTTVYAEDTIKELIFGSTKPRYYLARLQELMGNHKEIPFVARYDVTFPGNRCISVNLYEKSLAGYLRFQNYYLYFDWDGILVEIGTQRLEGVYEVKGLSVDHAVQGEKLPVSDGDSLRTILAVSQFLSNESVNLNGESVLLGSLCEGIRFRSDGVQLEFGELEVFLGNSDNIQEKLYAMEDIFPKLQGSRGVLYLDSYRSGDLNPSYVFKEK